MRALVVSSPGWAPAAARGGRDVARRSSGDGVEGVPKDINLIWFEREQVRGVGKESIGLGLVGLGYWLGFQGSG